MAGLGQATHDFSPRQNRGCPGHNVPVLIPAASPLEPSAPPPGREGGWSCGATPVLRLPSQSAIRCRGLRENETTVSAATAVAQVRTGMRPCSRRTRDCRPAPTLPARTARAQITWNRYSKMMIGIGIPSSQSRMPRMSPCLRYVATSNARSADQVASAPGSPAAAGTTRRKHASTRPRIRPIRATPARRRSRKAAVASSSSLSSASQNSRVAV